MAGTKETSQVKNEVARMIKIKIADNSGGLFHKYELTVETKEQAIWFMKKYQNAKVELKTVEHVSTTQNQG